jgi:hypothetical protein
MKTVHTLVITLLLISMASGCLQVQSPKNLTPTGAPTDNGALIAQILTSINIALQNETVKSYLTGNWSINGVALNAQIIRSGVGPGKPEMILNAPDVIFETDLEYVHVYVDMQNNTVVDIQTQGKRPNPCC